MSGGGTEDGKFSSDKIVLTEVMPVVPRIIVGPYCGSGTSRDSVFRVPHRKMDMLVVGNKLL